MDTYEKKYNEAFAWIRDIYPTLTGAAKEDAEHYFPELRESEDERIRKAVVSLVYEMKGTYQSFAKVELDKMVAWLEKQKENPKNAISIPADCATNAKCPYKIHGDEDFIGDIKDTPAYHFGFDEGVRSEREKQKEQKPVDYDHEMWKNCEANFEGGKKEVIDHPGKYGLRKEQKPAEWSEEDERIRNLAIEWAETMYGQFRFVDMGSTDFRKIVAWLKSLRPSWKPSEKQMNCLCAAVDAAIRKHNESVGGYEPARVLKSLYEDLKKL